MLSLMTCPHRNLVVSARTVESAHQKHKSRRCQVPYQAVRWKFNKRVNGLSRIAHLKQATSSEYPKNHTMKNHTLYRGANQKLRSVIKIYFCVGCVWDTMNCPPKTARRNRCDNGQEVKEANVKAFQKASARRVAS